MRNRLWTLTGAALCAIVLSACGENLDSGAVCPALCPGQDIDLREEVFEPVAVDTTLSGLLEIGSESELLIANRPGIVVSYGIVRFDTIPTRYVVAVGDTADITVIDSAYLRLRIDTAGRIATAPVTFEVYDVTGAPGDTSTAALVAEVVPENLVADTTLAPTAIEDSLRIQLPPEYLLDKIANDPRVRFAVRVTSTAPVQLRVFANPSNGTSSSAPLLIYDPAPTVATIAPFVVSPRSLTPDEPPGLALALRDFTVFAEGTPPPPAGTLAVGGLPARRTFFRFDLPRRILDSSTVVRATLFLTQRGDLPAVTTDSVDIIPRLGVGSFAVEDPLRQALLTISAIGLGVDTLTLKPGATNEAALDIVALVQIWARQDPDSIPPVLVLAAAEEGSLPGEILFYSSEAADPALRPRLRLRYIPAVDFGLP